MKRLFRFFVIFLGIIFGLTSCGNKVSKDTEKFYGKKFDGFNGGHVIVMKDKLIFRGPDPIKPNMNGNEMKTEEFKKKLEKAKALECDKPNVIEENGKKYLTANNFPYKLLIKADDLLLDEQDNEEYRFVNLNKK